MDGAAIKSQLGKLVNLCWKVSNANSGSILVKDAAPKWRGPELDGMTDSQVEQRAKELERHFRDTNDSAGFYAALAGTLRAMAEFDLQGLAESCEAISATMAEEAAQIWEHRTRAIEESERRQEQQRAMAHIDPELRAYIDGLIGQQK